MDTTDFPPGWAFPDPDRPAAGPASGRADWPPIPTLDRPAAATPSAGDDAPAVWDDRSDLRARDDVAAVRGETAARRTTPPGAGLPPVRGPAAGGADGDRAVTGVVPRPPAGVATWLPEGRWADSENEQVQVGADPPPKPASDRVGEERRRRGRRRVTAARWVARLAGWPRRVAAVVLLLAAVVLALRPDPPTAAVAPAPAGVPVVVAGRDLPAGAVLSRADLRTADLPSPAVPAGSVRQPASLLGRTVAGPVRRGEVLTDARVVGPGLTAGLGPEEVAAAPVRLADAQAAALVRSGDRVDVLGAPVEADAATGPRDAIEVATGVRVLAVLRGDGAADGVVIVVAAAPAVARRLAGAASRYRLTVTMRPP